MHLTTRLGTELSAEDQREVLSAYVHRFTKDHIPAWTRDRSLGRTCPVQFASDAEWLANTRFAVNRDGSLNHRIRQCHSSPTWPDNPELRQKQTA